MLYTCEGVAALFEDIFVYPTFVSPGLDTNQPRVPKIKTASGSSGGKSDFAFYTDGTFDYPPAIHKFELNFKSGDHEISRIGVDLQEVGVDVLYTDKWRNKDFRWEVKGIELPPSPETEYKQISGTRPLDSYELPGNQELVGYVALLQSFELEFQSSDYEIHKIAVAASRESHGVTVSEPFAIIEDDRGSAKYDFKIGIALVPNENVSGGVLTTGLRRSGGGSASRYIGTKSGYRAALVGFSFEFEGGDRDLDKIRVDMSRSGYVDVSFQDVNSDDAYAYEIWYAWIRIA